MFPQLVVGTWSRNPWKVRYGSIATVTGVFKNIADEFYRRIAAPYEDRQISANGDVPLYEAYTKRIQENRE